MGIKKINKELFIEENDFYDIKSLNRLMDNGTISGADEGFMSGYLEA
ncbi:hypothetical protein ACFL0E_00105 [Nanoarchaeota archaeon]